MGHNSFLPRIRDFFEDDSFSVFDNRRDSGLALSEDKGHVYVEAHLPGLSVDDIEISYQNGKLWITGEKKEETKDKEKKYYRKASSSFSYRIALPTHIDETKEPIAEYKDGVMRVTFDKLAGEEPKKIKIRKK